MQGRSPGRSARRAEGGRSRVEKDSTMVNLVTGQTETIDAYKGNGAYWFIFKK